MNELFIEIDKLKIDQSKDLEKLKNEFESNLKEIRLIHDQEKTNLESRLERSNGELKSLVSLIKQRDIQNEESEQTRLK